VALPQKKSLIGVGSMIPDELAAWRTTGAKAVGWGAEIRRRGEDAREVFDKASAVVGAVSHWEKNA